MRLNQPSIITNHVSGKSHGSFLDLNSLKWGMVCVNQQGLRHAMFLLRSFKIRMSCWALYVTRSSLHYGDRFHLPSARDVEGAAKHWALGRTSVYWLAAGVPTPTPAPGGGRAGHATARGDTAAAHVTSSSLLSLPLFSHFYETFIKFLLLLNCSVDIT
jgi:hypothetical protein